MCFRCVCVNALNKTHSTRQSGGPWIHCTLMYSYEKQLKDNLKSPVLKIKPWHILQFITVSKRKASDFIRSRSNKNALWHYYFWNLERKQRWSIFLKHHKIYNLLIWQFEHNSYYSFKPRASFQMMLKIIQCICLICFLCNYFDLSCFEQILVLFVYFLCEQM